MVDFIVVACSAAFIGLLFVALMYLAFRLTMSPSNQREYRDQFEEHRRNWW